ncbi:hypothetical protein C8D77_1011705 [Mesorhizobium loti]|jgi:hypothetical protein|uniref:Uncharacterized protein n=1 Tax=Rhizobium loti TaxID=381 RepID=A0A8E3B8F0_RHILI|nr:hypothetical protein C8D77_1011705 [Mesorhizobium loti]
MLYFASNQNTRTTRTVSLVVFGLLANSIVSEAAYSNTAPFVGVHSLRADNGDFDTWGDPATSFVAKAMVDPVQAGTIGNAGAESTSKCLGVSPRLYDPVSPNCRN